MKLGSPLRNLKHCGLPRAETHFKNFPWRGEGHVQSTVTEMRTDIPPAELAERISHCSRGKGHPQHVAVPLDDPRKVTKVTHLDVGVQTLAEVSCIISQLIYQF